LNAIDSTFATLRKQGKKAFVPFLTAGDPDIASTPALAKALLDAGANVLEIGFPYSDPIADGPVIQASYTRALDNGLKLDQTFAAARKIADGSPSTPLAAMVSYSLVHRRGPELFLDLAVKAGFAGLIVPDLPVEESQAMAELCKARDCKLIQLVTPTTSPDRARRIVRSSSGFVYVVSIAGITGERTGVPPELLEQLRWLRGETDLPLCVGFGVSKPEHVRTLRDHCDGVIVGSALVRLLEGPGTVEEKAGRLAGLARSLAGALDS
jgi:tryptophan synthase alpha chain